MRPRGAPASRGRRRRNPARRRESKPPSSRKRSARTSIVACETKNTSRTAVVLLLVDLARLDPRERHAVVVDGHPDLEQHLGIVRSRRAWARRCRRSTGTPPRPSARTASGSSTTSSWQNSRKRRALDRLEGLVGRGGEPDGSRRGGGRTRSAARPRCGPSGRRRTALSSTSTDSAGIVLGGQRAERRRRATALPEVTTTATTGGATSPSATARSAPSPSSGSSSGSTPAATGRSGSSNGASAPGSPGSAGWVTGAPPTDSGGSIVSMRPVENSRDVAPNCRGHECLQQLALCATLASIFRARARLVDRGSHSRGCQEDRHRRRLHRHRPRRDGVPAGPDPPPRAHRRGSTPRAARSSDRGREVQGFVAEGTRQIGARGVGREGARRGPGPHARSTKLQEFGTEVARARRARRRPGAGASSASCPSVSCR